MDSGVNEVKVYGFDSDLKCIQPLPIKNGALQVASVYNPATVDALNNNLFRATASLSNSPGVSVESLTINNAAATNKIIQVVSVSALINSLSGTATAKTVSLNAFVLTGAASTLAVDTVNVLTNVADPRVGITAYKTTDAVGAYISTLGGMTQAAGIIGIPVNLALQQSFPFINSAVPVFCTQNGGIAFNYGSNILGDTVNSIVTVYYKLIDV